MQYKAEKNEDGADDSSYTWCYGPTSQLHLKKKKWVWFRVIDIEYREDYEEKPVPTVEEQSKMLPMTVIGSIKPVLPGQYLGCHDWWKGATGIGDESDSDSDADSDSSSGSEGGDDSSQS